MYQVSENGPDTEMSGKTYEFQKSKIGTSPCQKQPSDLNAFSGGISNFDLSTSILLCLCSTDRVRLFEPFLIKTLQSEAADQLLHKSIPATQES